MDKAQYRKLMDWMKNDRHLQDWWEGEFVKSDAEIDVALRNKMFVRIKEETVGKSRSARVVRMNILRWAAMICLPVCLAFFTYYLIDMSQAPGMPLVVKAGKGDKARIELPDGTNVVLNSASQLSYLNDFGKKNRCVQLNGEAFFKVAHDESRTFIMQAGNLEVKVHGTSFNVSAYEDDEDIVVVLQEGKVGVYAQGMSHTMIPGDKLEYNKLTQKLTTTKVNSEDYIEWIKGNLYFDKESLKNIMNTLSRIYNVEIRFESDKLLNERFTGTIPGNGIRSALNMLMLTADFTYEMDGSVIVIKSK